MDEPRSEQVEGWSRDSLAELPYSYFAAIDAKDLEQTMAHYAEDAREIVMPDDVCFSGTAEIRSMYVNFFSSHTSIRHEVRNLVADSEQGKVATEQTFVGQTAEGRVQEMYNCNFFEVDAAGKITRVIIWMSGANPLT
jgi:ketosteroid isomerase-like protein